MSTAAHHNQVDVLVVGAGQAGLAAARALQRRDIDCRVHERHRRVGDSWRERFDSLVLFTPRELSALPGPPHRGDPRGYPSKDEMGDYLERFVAHFALPVLTGVVRFSQASSRLSRRPNREA